MASDEPPKSTKAHCNTCRHITNHGVLHSQKASGSDAEEGVWWETTFDMLDCLGCAEVTLRRSLVFSEDEGVRTTFYPPRASRWIPKWQYSLSPEMSELLVEIYAALEADSRRLAMMGARTAIETAMISKVGDCGTFADNLQALEENGFLSKTNRKYLEAALDAGNAAAHRAHHPTLKQLDTVMDIVENLLHSMFVLAKPVAELTAATPQRPARAKKKG
jgi:hypothetical protein